MVLVEIFVLNGDGSMFQVFTDLVTFDHQFVVTGSFIFPE